MLVFFQHHHARAFAEHEPVACLVPGTARAGGVVVAGGERSRCAETADPHRRYRRLRAARHHDVGITVLDQPARLADAVRRGGARRHHGEIRTFQPVHDREIAGHHVDDRAGDEERRDAPGPALDVFLVGILDHRQAPDARADDRADALCVLRRHLHAAVADRFDGGGQAEVNESIHSPRFLGRQVLRYIEPLHFSGDLRGHRRCVEMRDSGNARLASENVRPGGLQSDPDRGHDAQAGDDNSAA
jgi:hypothetical protein